MRVLVLDEHVKKGNYSHSPILPFKIGAGKKNVAYIEGSEMEFEL